MEKLLYKFPVFEGPLDLLLQLITKNKIDIYDIEIHLLLEQYMKQIDAMKEANMDIASEFLEMAARLVQIKSIMLLPKKQEEAEEMKKELTGQLIEYQECKRIAKMLSEYISFDYFCREPVKLEQKSRYERKHDVNILVTAYLNAVGRGKRRLPPSTEDFSMIVARPVVSVNTKIVYVLKKLWKNKNITAYSSLFIGEGLTKSDLVATFLAVLELVKGKRIRIEGDGQEAKVKLIDHKNRFTI